MTRLNLLRVVLIGCSLASCKPDPSPIMDNDLGGNWTGDLQTQQLGSCGWNTPAPTTKATFNVVNNSVTATVIQTYGPNSAPIQLSGTINGNAVVLSQTNNALCYGTPRTYTSRFEGTIQGNTLTLVSRDSLCPVQGCIFLRTLKLTRQ